MRVFSISGAEGQLTLGALAAAVVGAVWPALPSPLAPTLAATAAVLAGTLWGAIPGWLRARRGSHEVINTIMLNFIAAGLASYVALNLLKNPDSQNPETRPVGPGYLIHQFAVFDPAPVGMALPLAVAAASLSVDPAVENSFGLRDSRPGSKRAGGSRRGN